MWQDITISTCAFTADPTDEAAVVRQFEMAMEAGFSGFEIARSSRDVSGTMLRAIRKSGAKIIAVHGILGGHSYSPDPALRESAVETAYRHLAEFGEYAPCPIVEHYLDRFNSPEPGKYFRDSVEKLLTRTEKDGFVFCMENAPYKPESNERFPCVAEVAEFVRSFGENRMFMTFDLNHANLHEDPIAVTADCAGLVRHIHVSDNHGYREEHLLPGQGNIDLAAVLAALYRHGYDGPCNMEIGFPKGTQAETADYRRIYEYMEQLKRSLPQCAE